MRCCAHARGFSRASLACAHATSATPTRPHAAHQRAGCIRSPGHPPRACNRPAQASAFGVCMFVCTRVLSPRYRSSVDACTRVNTRRVFGLRTAAGTRTGIWAARTLAAPTGLLRWVRLGTPRPRCTQASESCCTTTRKAGLPNARCLVVLPAWRPLAAFVRSTCSRAHTRMLAPRCRGSRLQGGACQDMRQGGRCATRWTHIARRHDCCCC